MLNYTGGSASCVGDAREALDLMRLAWYALRTIPAYTVTDTLLSHQNPQCTQAGFQPSKVFVVLQIIIGAKGLSTQNIAFVKLWC
jgi:hypothetical protein